MTIQTKFQPCFLILIVTLLSVRPTFSQGTETRLQSPDGKLELVFSQKEVSPGKRQMLYRVDYQKKPVILESGLGIQIDNHVFEHAMAHKVTTPPGTLGVNWCDNLVIKNVVTTTKDTTWKPVYGERSQIRDNYNQVEIQLQKEDSPDYTVSVIFRAYNAGVAFRYFFPEHPNGMYYRVAAENSEFALPANTKAWYTAWAQGPYSALPLANWPENSERPLTLSLPNGLYASLAEAQLTDYAMTKFKLSPDKPSTVLTSMYESADLMSDVGTPWRVIMVAERLGQLLENNDIMLNLNPPTTLQNTDWIKPGKVMREVTLTDAGANACIDFAAAHNLQYILFDWKWYGPAFSFNSDATKVVAKMNLQKIIDYGKSKERSGAPVGVILYVNLQALYKQMDEIFPLYKKWGVKGVKFGFVEVGSHRWTTWLTEAKRKAMENGLMVNIHDEYRPTGTSRTYPNVMTQEGIRGNEEFPDATHDTVLPFTRYLAGAGDYTICYYDKRLKNTHAHQLAMNVISYSPLQSVFWYDKPELYGGEPEIEFFAKVPTVWDDTKVIHDAIGEYVTIARRRGDDWFVGTISNNDGRSLELPLDFLPKGKTYTAHIYSDDPTVKTKTQVRVSTKSVKAGQSLDMNLLPRGGQAVWLTPEAK
ncbi:glycoside hydrolase family 97 protein [Spirosoma migulaei]